MTQPSATGLVGFWCKNKRNSKKKKKEEEEKQLTRGNLYSGVFLDDVLCDFFHKYLCKLDTVFSTFIFHGN